MGHPTAERKYGERHHQERVRSQHEVRCLQYLWQYWKRVWSQNRWWREVKCGYKGHLIGDWVSFRPWGGCGHFRSFCVM